MRQREGSSPFPARFERMSRAGADSYFHPNPRADFRPFKPPVDPFHRIELAPVEGVSAAHG